MTKQEEIKILHEFRQKVELVRDGKAKKTTRGEIAQMKPIVLNIMKRVKTHKTLVLYPPPALGGPVLHLNPIESIYDVPFNMHYEMRNRAIDCIDETIGVLQAEVDVNEINDDSFFAQSPIKSKNIFIVHGHDEVKRVVVEAFIRSINYNPIVLFKEPSIGQTIIEKIESNAENICFAIVIYTSCDLGKAKECSDLTPRARQNVVFEHGYMCAHLGRKKVVALLENGVEQPGDLEGVIYIKLDDAGVWQIKVAQEMNAVGLDVDLKNIKL